MEKQLDFQDHGRGEIPRGGWQFGYYPMIFMPRWSYGELSVD